MDAFTIKDLENLSGIKAHTIRIWEQRYSFLKPNRTDTNIRYYTNDELKKILNVALLNKYGYKISHINRMTDDQLNERIVSLSQMEAVQERIVNDLIVAMVDMDIYALENILNSYISAKGIEKAIAQVIFPLLEKIGILWLTNHINPAQEHIVSNLIRQKIIVGIDKIDVALPNAKTTLLFLPEDEYHEIGLLYMYYQFKIRGFNVLYLGSSTPLADVKYVLTRKKVDFVYTHLVSAPSNFNLDKFLTNYTIQANKGIPLIITGKYAKINKKGTPANIFFKQSIAEVMEFAGTL